MQNCGFLSRKAIGALAATALMALTPLAATASSHSEAPLIAQDPAVDNCDVYFFVDPNDSSQVVLLATFNGLANPASGPNYKSFADGAWYDFRIDNNGDGIEDVTYRFIFSTSVRSGETFLYNTGPIHGVNDPNLNVVQSYTLYKITGPAANPQPSQITVVGGGTGNPFYTVPWNIGPKSFPGGYRNITGTIYTTSDGGRVAAGPRADPFFVDLQMVFDLINLDAPGRPGEGLGNMGGGKNTLNGFNVMALMLEVPISNLTKNHDRPTNVMDPDSVVGLWSTASRPSTRVLNGDGTVTNSGNYVQVSRLGNPLINEVAIALADKDRWNATEPKDDLANFGSYALDPEVPHLLKALFNIDSPPPPRTDVVGALFTGLDIIPNTRPNETVADEIRLNVAIPPVPIASANPLGLLGGDLAGFPNGRRVCDDVVDIELRVLAGGTPLTPDFNHAPNNQLGDGVDTPDPACRDSFPFMVTPYEGFEDQHAGAARPVHAADAREIPVLSKD
jgi:hypothetical protein